jgi:hypothetical protein
MARNLTVSVQPVFQLSAVRNHDGQYTAGLDHRPDHGERLVDLRATVVEVANEDGLPRGMSAVPRRRS